MHNPAGKRKCFGAGSACAAVPGVPERHIILFLHRKKARQKTAPKMRSVVLRGPASPGRGGVRHPVCGRDQRLKRRGDGLRNRGGGSALPGGGGAARYRQHPAAGPDLFVRRYARPRLNTTVNAAGCRENVLQGTNTWDSITQNCAIVYSFLQIWCEIADFGRFGWEKDRIWVGIRGVVLAPLRIICYTDKILSCVNMRICPKNSGRRDFSQNS